LFGQAINDGFTRLADVLERMKGSGVIEQSGAKARVITMWLVQPLCIIYR
jgi:hypothetical protein